MKSIEKIGNNINIISLIVCLIPYVYFRFQVGSKHYSYWNKLVLLSLSCLVINVENMGAEFELIYKINIKIYF